jgi:hypothetical protein
MRTLLQVARTAPSAEYFKGYRDGLRWDIRGDSEALDEGESGGDTSQLAQLIVTAIEDGYTSGVDALLSYALDGDTIYGRFRDGAKVFGYTLKDDEISYWLLRGQERTDSLSLKPAWNAVKSGVKRGVNRLKGRAAKGAGKDNKCTKGIKCGNSCISSKKKCDIPPSPQAKQAIAQARTTLEEFERDFNQAVERDQSKKRAAETPQMVKAPKLREAHLISQDERINKDSIEEGFSALQTRGAAERVAKLKTVINNQGLQGVFTPRGDEKGMNERFMALEDSPVKRRAIAKIREAERRLGKNNPEYKAFAKSVIQKTVGPVKKANGFTYESGNFVVIHADLDSDPSKPWKPDAKSMSQIADGMYRDAEKKGEAKGWSASSSDKDSDLSAATRNFVTYMHELGHQIHYAAGKPAKPGDAKNLTRYSETNDNEYFAEHFAAWMIDADRFARYDPVGAAFIEDTVNRAMMAKKRV